MTARSRVLIGVSVLWIPLAFLFDGVTVLLLPLRLSGDASSIGLVSFVGLGAAAGWQLVAGWGSDRLRSRLDRRVFVALMALPAACGLWLLVGSTGLLAAMAGYLLVEVGASGIQAGQQTLIPEHVDAPLRGRASGLKTAADVGGSFLAFLVLGTLLATGELGPAALVTATVLVVGVLVVQALVPPVEGRRVPSPSGRPPPGLARLVVARFLFLFATFAVGRFLVLLVAERLVVTPEGAVSEAGTLLALFTLATAVAALGFGWLADRSSADRLMVLGAATSTAGIAALVPDAGLGGVVVGGLVMSLGTAAFVTANWSATTSLVSPAESGRWMAVANLGTGAAAATAGILGPLIDVAGFPPALLISAVVSAAAVVPLAAWAPRARHAVERPT